MKSRVMWLATSVVLSVASPAMAAADHLGQKPSAHVVLEVVVGANGGCGVDGFEFGRTLPDGTRDQVNVNSNGFFRIPAGKVLVVTDVDWQQRYPGGPGSAQTLRLVIENLGEQLDRHSVYESTIALDASGYGGASEHMTTGFVVSSSARICPEIRLASSATLSHLLIRGYLAPDK